MEEPTNNAEVYYAKEEAALLIRLMEYRDNYIYWTLDFSYLLPTIFHNGL